MEVVLEWLRRLRWCARLDPLIFSAIVISLVSVVSAAQTSGTCDCDQQCPKTRELVTTVWGGAFTFLVLSYDVLSAVKPMISNASWSESENVWQCFKAFIWVVLNPLLEISVIINNAAWRYYSNRSGFTVSSFLSPWTKDPAKIVFSCEVVITVPTVISIPENFIGPDKPSLSEAVVIGRGPEEAQDLEAVVIGRGPEEARDSEVVVIGRGPEEARDSEVVVIGRGPEEAQDSEAVVIGSEPEEAQDSEAVVIGHGPEEARDSEAVVIGRGPEEARDSEAVVIGRGPEEARDSEVVVIGRGPEEARDSEAFVIGSEPEEAQDSEAVVIGSEPEEAQDSEAVVIGRGPEEAQDSEAVVIGSELEEAQDSGAVVIGRGPEEAQDSEAVVIGSELEEAHDSEAVVIGRGPEEVQETRDILLDQKGKQVLLEMENVLPPYDQLSVLQGSSGWATIISAVQSGGYTYGVVVRTVQGLPVSPIEVVALILSIDILIKALLHNIASSCDRPLHLYLTHDQAQTFANQCRDYNALAHEDPEIRAVGPFMVIVLLVSGVAIYYIIHMWQTTRRIMVVPIILTLVGFNLQLLVIWSITFIEDENGHVAQWTTSMSSLVNATSYVFEGVVMWSNFMGGPVIAVSYIIALVVTIKYWKADRLDAKTSSMIAQIFPYIG